MTDLNTIAGLAWDARAKEGGEKQISWLHKPWIEVNRLADAGDEFLKAMIQYHLTETKYFFTALGQFTVDTGHAPI